VAGEFKPDVTAPIIIFKRLPTAIFVAIENKKNSYAGFD
jgi:hypothetical protein